MTYNNLEGDKLGKEASTELRRASVISPDTRVAALLWPISLKRTRKVLCTCVLYHRMFGDKNKQVHRLCRSVEQRYFASFFVIIRYILPSNSLIIGYKRFCLIIQDELCLGGTVLDWL